MTTVSPVRELNFGTDREAPSTQAFDRGLMRASDPGGLPVTPLGLSTSPRQPTPGKTSTGRNSRGRGDQNTASPSGSKGGDGGVGASLFSVPPREAPATGIYALPEAAFKIRDLDTGMEYALDKRYWIKDRDTGAVYVLEGCGDVPGGPPGSTANGAGGASSPGAVSQTSPGRVRELFSGRALSLDEFEDAMGYSAPLQRQSAAPAAASTAAGASGSEAAARSSVPAAAGPGQSSSSAGQGGMAALAHWFRHGMDTVLSRNGQRGAGEPGGSATTPGIALPGSAVRTSAHGKKGSPRHANVRLLQHLEAHAGVVWAMAFSRDGRYLASAGQDCTVRVWDVLTAPPGGESTRGTASVQPHALLAASPHRVYTGHKQDVLDLTWSRTQFLLSASMDKTVRLWHVSMDECLRVFKHSDFVTAIDFHPSDDRRFISGSIDGKLRLWSIPDQKVVSWQDAHEMVTAAAYAPSGLRVVVGTMKGKCRFYGVQDNVLEYEAQLDVKNARGQHARGKKITGLAFLPRAPSMLLITSNDSRIRLYEGYNLRAKFKGHANRSTQIRAAVSPAGDAIACGSDDGWVYQWAVPSTHGGASDDAVVKEKVLAYECFLAAPDVVTVALYAPERALAAWPGAGQTKSTVILAAGYGGEINVYEDVHTT